MTGPDNKVVLEQGAAGLGARNGNCGPRSAADAALGYYNIDHRCRAANDARSAAGSFYVEEYKKPEYQVTVKPAAPRVLQGNSIQATIEARYFFGEPVAGAKVTYVVHTSHALLVG